MNEQKTASSAQAQTAPGGLEHPGVLDFIGYEAAAGEVLVVMVEKRPWTDPERQLFQLQEKLNAYLSFILDGEMQDVYPQFVGKPVRIRLECAHPPGPEFVRFLQIVHDQTALQDIAFEVLVVGGETCGCGQPQSLCSRSTETP
jgi:hypothetical protein